MKIMNGEIHIGMENLGTLTHFVKNMEVISGLLKKSKIRQKKLLSLDVWEIQRIVLINQKMIS